MASTDNKISISDLKPGMQFRHSGHKYRNLEVHVVSGVAYVYTATSVFPMQFYPDQLVELV